MPSNNFITDKKLQNKLRVRCTKVKLLNS